jgi:hypothetical protein
MSPSWPADRLRDAVDAVAIPPFPAVALAARVDDARAPARTLPRISFPRLAAAVAVLVAGLVVAASGAIAVVPETIPPRLAAALARMGIDLHKVRIVEPHPVSVEEAQSRADFPIVVPPNVRIRRTEITPGSHGHSTVILTLIYDRRSELALTETTMAALQGRLGRRPTFNGAIVDSRGTLRRVADVVWQIGPTVVFTVPYDARSRAFAERVRRDSLAAVKRR